MVILWLQIIDEIPSASQEGLCCGDLVKCDRNNNENDCDTFYRPYLI